MLKGKFFLIDFYKSTRIPRAVMGYGYTVTVLCYALKSKEHFLAWYDTDDKEWRTDIGKEAFLEEEFVWIYPPTPQA